MPLGAGYGLFGDDGGVPPVPPGPSFIQAVFVQPISVTYDESGYLWTADRGTALLQKIDSTAVQPGVVAAVDLSSLGVSNVREVKYDPVSGHIFAACHESNIVVIVNKTTNAVIGKVLLGELARSTITDGAGNFFAAESPGGAGTSVLRKYSIAAVLAAYPSNGTQTASFPYSFHIENMSFGGGFIWAAVGTQNYIHPPVLNVYQAGYGGALLRIDPSTGTLVTARADRNRYVWNAFYALGSIWVGNTGPDIQRWDPATFSPQLSPGNPVYVTHPTDTPASFNTGMMTGEFALDHYNSRVWMGSNISDRRIHYVDPATNVITVIQGHNTFFNADSLAFGAANLAVGIDRAIWGTSRFGSISNTAPGLYRYMDQLGVHNRSYRIINGSNGTAWFSELQDSPIGPGSGGTALTLKGGGFSTATGVVFRYAFTDVAATSFVVVDDSTITCVSPVRPGSFTASNPFADVTVSRPSGNLLWSGGFKYTS